MNVLGREIDYGPQQLREAPGLTMTAVFTLAFGIGSTTAIYSIVEGVLLEPTVIVMASLSIFLLALPASLIPARRAAAIDPMRALRRE